MAQPFTDGAGWHPGPIVLRSSWPRVLAASVSHLPIALMPATIAQLHGQPISSFELWLAGFVLLSSALSLVLGRRGRVELGPGRLTMRDGFRSRHIAVSEIQAVTLERVNGSRAVTVWTRSGKQRRIGAAGRTQGLLEEHFERDWHLIGQWWLANGGMPAEQQWTAPAIASGWTPNGFDWRPQT
ncbi:hypothetical protein acdb102_44000 [Acidothermaceae bacterium B102]|nr:hypothetical protein acdb102_44000 [Acidothermaceae bacterium B102]